jgi:large subunit ribosomal protein L19
MKHRLIEKVDVEQRRKDDLPELRIGDELAVHVKIREGDKERIQVFRGTLIARDGGGATETITVRRISFGYGVERVFPLHSPNIVKIEVEGHGRARRAKLYYLRERKGKAARVEAES